MALPRRIDHQLLAAALVFDSEEEALHELPPNVCVEVLDEVENAGATVPLNFPLLVQFHCPRVCRYRHQIVEYVRPHAQMKMWFPRCYVIEWDVLVDRLVRKDETSWPLAGSHCSSREN